MKTIVDIIILVCFLGSFVFIVSGCVVVLLIEAKKETKKNCILYLT